MLGVGLVAIVVVTVLVVARAAPALPVAAVGLVAVALRSWRSGQTVDTARSAARILGVPVLVGLFGLAVALGTLGRSWSGPATLLSHLDAWGTAAVAALTSVAVNNLPAASLLAARFNRRTPLLPLPHGEPGLNVGPNLFVTGSLAWILWLRAARHAGGRPEVRRASLLGLVTVPLAIAAAVGVLLLSGAS